MSSNSQSLSGDPLVPLQRVSLNSSKTNLILDSDSGSSSLLVSTGSAASLYIDKFANVGINTKSPTAQLEVSGNDGACLRLRYGQTSAFSTFSMNSLGELKIDIARSTGRIATDASLALTGHNGVDTGLVLGGGLVKASATHLNYTIATPGHATASSALVLDADRNIDSISTLTATNLKGSILDANQPYITSLGTLSGLTVSGSVSLTSISNATSYSNGGAMTIDGGLAVAKNAYVGNDVFIGGNLYVTGTTTTVDSSSITVDDNTMTLNASPITANDAGVLVGRYQKSNNTGLGSVVSDNPDFATTVASATIRTITMNDGNPSNNHYNDWWIHIGIGIVRKVASYDGATKTITLTTDMLGVPPTGSEVKLFGHNFAGIVWNDANRRFATMFAARDSSPTLTFMGYADLATDRCLIQNVSDSASATTGALTVAGGAGIAKSLRVGDGIYGKVMTADQPNITTLGRLTSLIVDGSMTASAITGIIQTAVQPNITSVGTLTGLGISSANIDALTISNTANISASTKFVSGAITGSIGINGVSSSSNPSSMVLKINDSTAIAINQSGLVSITNNLTVGSTIAAGSYTIGSTAIAMELLSGSITAGSAVANKVLSVDANLNVKDINNLTATAISATSLEVDDLNATNVAGTLTTASQPNITSIGTLSSLSIGASTISSNDVKYIEGVTAGQAGVSKALVTDEYKAIYGIKNIGITGSEIPIAMTNSQSAQRVSQTMTTNRYTLSFGARGSSNATNPDTAYWSFNDKAGIMMNHNGEVSINTGTFGYGLNVDGTINATGFYLNGVSFDAGVVSYITDVSAGTAASSKALILDSNRDVGNIHSLTTERLIVGTTDLEELIANADVTAGITAGVATKNKVLVAGSDFEIGGLNKVSTNELQMGTSILNATDASILKNIAGGTAIVDAAQYKQGGIALDFSSLSYINGSVAGSAAFSKALVLGPTGNISGISMIGATALSLGSQTFTETEASYLSEITPGSATISKALVLNSLGAIAGVKSLSVSGPLMVSNSSASDSAEQTFTSDTYTLKVGVHGSANASNADKAYINYNNADRVLINTNGDVAVGTSTFSQKFNVGGAVNATGYYVNGTKLEMVGQSFLTNAQAGLAVGGSALVLDDNKNVSGIATIGVDAVDLGVNTFTDTEAGYLIGITAGQADVSKALVLGSNGAITGIQTMSISGSGTSLLTLTNSAASSSACQTITSDINSLIFGVNGSTNATNPSMAYWSYGGATRILMDTNGKIGIGASPGGSYTLNVGGIVNATDIYIGGTQLDHTSIGLANTYLSSITAGQASQSKALILDGSSAITGIARMGISGTSDYQLSLTNATASGAATQRIISDTNTLEFGVKGSTNATNPNMVYWMYGGATRMLMDTSGNMAIGATPNSSYALNVGGTINATNVYVNGSPLSIPSIDAALTGFTAGQVDASKVLVVDTNKKIKNIASLGIGALDYSYDGSVANNSGVSILRAATATLTNSTTAATGTDSTMRAIYEFNAPTLDATNTITTTNASTLYISGAPISGAKNTITNKYALYIAGGNCYSEYGFMAGNNYASLTMSGSNSYMQLSGANSYIQMNGSAAYLLIDGNSSASTNSNSGAIRTNGGIYVGADSLFGGKVTCSSLYVNGQPITGGSSTTVVNLTTAKNFSATSRIAIQPTKLPSTAKWTQAIVQLSCNWQTVCWSPSLRMYAACATSGTGTRIMTSVNGTGWALRDTTNNDSLYYGMCWSPDKKLFVAIGSTKSLTSSDGITWTPGTATYTDNGWMSVAWSADVAKFVAVGTSAAMYSSDGNTWTIASGVPTSYWSCVCWSPEKKIFVAVSQATIGSGTNQVMTSSDGITWTGQVAATANSWNSVCWSPELGMFAAVSSTGTGNRVMTSTDGTAWISQTNAYDANFLAITWSSEMMIFMAVGTSPTFGVPQSMWSSNGINWYSIGTPYINNANYNDVCWSPELMQFVAVSDLSYGTMVNSVIVMQLPSIATPNDIYSNGTVRSTKIDTGRITANCIQMQDSTTNYQDLSTTNVRCVSRATYFQTPSSYTTICYSPELKIYTALSQSNPPVCTYSTNVGVAWFSMALSMSAPTPSIYWSKICWAPELGIFVAVANTTTNINVMTSSNGISWFPRASTAAATRSWKSVCWAAELGIFVAISQDQVDKCVMTSPDGINWTLRTASSVSWWATICWAPELSLFIVSGGNSSNDLRRIMVSPDGINWTLRNVPTAAATAGVSFVGIAWAPELGILVATPYQGNPIYSKDTINWTTGNAPQSSYPGWGKILWAPEIRQFIMMAQSNPVSIQTSFNGTTFSYKSTNNTAVDVQYVDMCWSGDHVRMIAIGSSTTVLSLEAFGLDARRINSRFYGVACDNIVCDTNISLGSSATTNIPLYIGTSGGTVTSGLGTYSRVVSGSTTISTGTASLSSVSIQTAGRIACSGELDVYSDVRAKKNINPISTELACRFVDEVVPKVFAYKTEEQRTNYGYIAQDLIRHEFTDLLTVASDDNMEEETDEYGITSPAKFRFGIITGNIIPLLHLKLKSLSDDHEETKKERDQLLTKVSTLEERLAALEALILKK